MKKGYSPLKFFAEILLVLIIILTIIAFISPTYRELFVNGIKKLFGYEIESEVLHEKNIQAEEEFKLIEKNIDKCKKSSKTNCGCSFNINNFNKNHMILSRDSEIRLINKGKIERRDILKDINQGTLIKKISIQNTNCFFDKKINKVNIAKIFFDKTIPYIYEARGGIFVKNEIPLNTNYPFYKNSQAGICWLSEKVQNIREC